MRILTSLLICIFLSFNVQSQALEFGISLGLSGYAGDLDSPELSTNLKNMKRAGGVFVKNVLTDRFAVRGNLFFGKVIGDDALSSKEWQQNRNLSFKSNIVEVAAMLEVNLFKFGGEEGKRLTPYFAAGAAYLHHNPTTEFNGQDFALQPLGTEGQGAPGYDDPYSLNLLAIPMGGGLKFKLNDKISLQGELLSRFTFSDYIDDVSGTYVNYFELLASNGSQAAALGNRHPDFAIGSQIQTGSQRGKSDVNDYIYSGTFSVVINIGELDRGGKGEGCYKF